MADKIEVSTTTVIRFCYKAGFDGYKDFQESVKENLKFFKTLPDKFLRTVDNAEDNPHFRKTINNTVYCINKTFENISEEKIGDCVDLIKSANRVFCFGLKESYSLAHYTYTRLMSIRNDVFMLSAGSSGEIESLLSLKENDVCIFFLFHRYTRLSVKILEALKKFKIKVILITSPPVDEIEKNAQIVFDCHVNIDSLKNSYAAPITLIDCLCNSLAVKTGEKALGYMKDCETLFKDFTF
jgi:DNA-binding MurR/RpiR family transcriptional regulator